MTSRGIADGPASAGVGFSVGAGCGWSPGVFLLAFGVEVRGWLGAIEFFRASGVTGFCLASETVAGNRGEVVIEVHGVRG